MKARRPKSSSSEEGVGSSRASGEAAKKKRAKFPQDREKSNVGNARDQARASTAES
jgi:hypothetical protein